MELELGAVLAALKKWFWVPLVLLLVLGFTGYRIAERQTKVYTATSTLVVEMPFTGTTSTSSNLVARQMPDSYGLMLDTDSLRDQIAEQAQVGDLDGYQVSISVPAGTSHLNISATHTNPESALAVANATLDVVLMDYESNSQERLDDTTEALGSELDGLREERDLKQQELAALESSADPSGNQRRELSREITQLDQRISDLEARIDRMRTDFQLNQPNLLPVKPSVPPTTPNNLRPEVAGILGALLGGLAGAAFIVLTAVFNNKISSVADWRNRSDVPVLGEIPHSGRMDTPARHMFLLTHPTDAAAEAVRILVTGLDFASFPGTGKKVLQVTSPGPSSGKTTLSANLAAHFAQLGKRVVLVDCDLHRPRLHSIFSVERDQGLTTLFTNPGTRVQDIAARVALPGLFLIPSGALLPNSAELFSSDRFRRLLDELKADFDVVILDTPPILLFSDSHRIASRADAVVAVGRLDQTKYPDMDRTLEAIESSGTHLLGTVWVGSKPLNAQYYYRNRRPRRFAF